MGISEREYAEMLRRNGGPEGISVKNDSGHGPTPEYYHEYLEANADSLGIDVPPPLAAQSIVLALPPSANRYWRYGPNGVHVSEEAENYKAGVRWKALHQHMTPMAGNVAVYVNVYRAQKRGDLDNYAKVLCDSLNGAAYHDDSQVAELHMWLHDDKDNPRVEVEIRSTKGAR
jgi:Holliday junction resolvase RusA-like endonuclease